MAFTRKLDRLIPDLAATLIRFPVPAAIAAAACLILNIAKIRFDNEAWQIVVTAACAFLAAGAAHLFGEGRQFGMARSAGLALAAGALAGAAAYFPGAFDSNVLFLFAGLVPALMVAAYLHRGASQEALWLFNLRLGMAALLAAVVGLVFAAGLSSIVAALNTLFGIDYGRMHEHIWLTALTLIGPVYGLALMPRDLKQGIVIGDHRGALLERGISVLMNFIAVPVVIVYALILHAYAVMIAIAGELPKGQIATMVSIFAVGGTAAWLVAWPWREEGTRLLRLFMRGWFFLLIVPAALLAAAIARRLSDYGVTPERYGIVLVAVWVAALALYLAIRRNRADMRAILGAAAAVLLVGAAGPWGANGMTITSQVSRLAALLETYGVLKDGTVTAPGKLLSAEVTSQGYSIVDTLHDARGLERLRPWFGERAGTIFAAEEPDWQTAQLINEALGFSSPTMSPDYVSLAVNAAAVFDVPAGGAVLGPFQGLQEYGPAAENPMTASFGPAVLTIRLEKDVYRVPQRDLLQRAKAALAANPDRQEPLRWEIAAGVTLVIDQIYGNINASPPLGSIRFWIIRQPPP